MEVSLNYKTKFIRKTSGQTLFVYVMNIQESSFLVVVLRVRLALGDARKLYVVNCLRVKKNELSVSY